MEQQKMSEDMARVVYELHAMPKDSKFFALILENEQSVICKGMNFSSVDIVVLIDWAVKNFKIDIDGLIKVLTKNLPDNN